MPKAKTAPAPKRVGKTLADFRQLHDKSFIVPQRLKAALAKLGPDGWEYEKEMMTLSGVSSTDLGEYRDQFAAFQALVKTTKSTGGGVREKIIWCGSTAFAKKLGGPRIVSPTE